MRLIHCCHSQYIYNNNKQFPKMNSSGRLILDQPVKEDFKRFYEINADPGTNLFNPAGAMDFASAEKAFNKMIEHWEENGFGSWSIKEKENPAFIIGFGGVTNRLYGDELKLNVGYRFDKKFWGKGYATALKDQLFIPVQVVAVQGRWPTI